MLLALLISHHKLFVEVFFEGVHGFPFVRLLQFLGDGSVPGQFLFLRLGLTEGAGAFVPDDG